MTFRFGIFLMAARVGGRHESASLYQLLLESVSVIESAETRSR
jgi:hypothetical protein